MNQKYKDTNREGDEMSIQSKLKSKFEDLVGEVIIKQIGNTVSVSGSIFVSNEEVFNDFMLKILYEEYPNALFSNSLKINEFTVVQESVESNKEKETVLDEINILYYGYLDVNHIKPNDEFKVIHQDNRHRLDNAIRVLNFITPIILDSNLKVIDGNFRLQLAEANDIKEVMVVVIDDNDKRADFLRLALNRTAEFQRWSYREVDDYVDATPQAQPLLEPIGFFGRNVLPESFFSPTVIQYVIDPFNEKQKQYSQEIPLAEYAKMRREEMSRLSKEKRAKKPKKENAVSLFNLEPEEEDFLSTYDIEQEMEVFVDKYRGIAGEITEHVDEIKKAEIAEKGGVWQHKHRSTLEVAESNRADAIEIIQESDLLTDDEKSEVVENIDDYSDHIDNIEELVKDLRGDDA